MAYSFDTNLMLETAIPVKTFREPTKLLSRRHKRRSRRVVRSV